MVPTFLFLLISVSAVTESTTVKETCPDSLLDKADPYYLKVSNGSCFYFALSERKDYNSANRFCKEDDGTLAMPKTKWLNQFLTDQILIEFGNSEEVWIGLHDKKNETEFVWEDGSPLVWSNFAPLNGPGNLWVLKEVEDCVALQPRNRGLWHDYQCDSNLLSWATANSARKMYVCQYDVRGGQVR